MLGAVASIASTTEIAPVSPRWERVAAVMALSLFGCGTGQLFNRQPRKGFILALVAHLLEYLLAYPTVMLSVPAMIAALTASAVWKIVVIFDVGYFAAKPNIDDCRIALSIVGCNEEKIRVFHVQDSLSIDVSNRLLGRPDGCGYKCLSFTCAGAR